AGVERQHAVIEAAGKRDRYFGHDDFGSPRGRCSANARLFPASTIMSHLVLPAKDISMTHGASPHDLRKLLVPDAALLLPGVSNALAARVVADLGFPVAYVTGAGIANTFLGLPDNGLVTMTELVEHVAAIRDAFPGPLVVDMDTGFGNALNTQRAVRALER